MIVPFTRTLHRGMKGRDVLAVKRALAHAKYRRWGFGFNIYFLRRLASDLKRFQHAHGLRADGVYGPKTHAKLMHYFDHYGASLMVKVSHKLKANNSHLSGKIGVVHAAMIGYNYRYKIHYTQSSSRMMIVRHRIKDLASWMRRKGYLYEDCSSFATGCYYIAGLLDPNGLNFNGQGYTGTLAAHGRRVSSPQPGDLVLYGWGFPYHHVAIYVGGGRVVSHGSEIGPLLLYMRYRSDLAMIRRYG